MNNPAPDGVDGNYNFDAKGEATRVGFVTILRDFSFIPAEVKQMQAVVQQAKVNNASLEEFTQQVSTVNSALAKSLNNYFERNQYNMNALTLLLAALAFLYSILKTDPPATTINFNFPTNPAQQEIRVQRPPLASGQPKRGSSLTPPLTKKQRQKKRRK